MSPRRIMIGTAGHVDHGKTSLVKHLTGIETDTLKEEKARGLSINLGFAPCILEDDLVAGLVDCPGHEKFIRNMIAGASGLDIVLLVVAADDGIMPQTREHLFILDRLGLTHGIIAINKTDLVDEETLELVKMEIDELLEGTFLENAPQVAVSAATGKGIEELKSLVTKLAREAPNKKTKGFFRLPLQRVFSKQGFGCIVTGVPFSGQIHKGDELEALPHKTICRVRGLQAYGKEVETAEAGHSVALNLAGVDYRDLKRGHVLASPHIFEMTEYLQVAYKRLPKTKWPRNYSEVVIHLGTSTEHGQIVWLEDKNEEGALAQIRLKNPALAAPGDYFLVRDSSAKHTLGGGPIISIANHKITRRMSSAIENLRTLNRHRDNNQIKIRTHLKSTGLATEKDLEKLLLQPVTDFSDDLKALIDSGDVIEKNHLFFLKETPDTLVSEVKEYLTQFYKNHSTARWVPLSTLLEKYGESTWNIILGAPSFSQTLKRSGRRICLKDRLVPLTKVQRQWADRLIKELTQGGFTPLLPEEVLSGMPQNNKPKDILKALVDNQEILKLSDKVYWTHETFEKACDVISELGREHPIIEIAHIKDTLGLSRKFAIPLLELTDKSGLTRRVENGRELIRNQVSELNL